MHLTDEDRNWIALAVRTEIDRAIGESEARTTSLIAALDDKLIALDQKLTALDEIVKGKIAALEEKVNAVPGLIYAMETKLLTAFHPWASAADQKIRSQREALRALDLQIEEIAARVKKLEADSDTRH